MLVIRRVELLMLLMEILGDSADEIRDRELTPVELSLSELIFEQAAATMSESWPDQESLTFQLGELTNQPNRSRMFPLDKMLLVAGLNLQLPNRRVRAPSGVGQGRNEQAVWAGKTGTERTESKFTFVKRQACGD